MINANLNINGTSRGKALSAEIKTYIDGLTTPLSFGQIKLLDVFVKEVKSGLGISNLSDAFDVMYILANETEESSLRNLVKRAHDATAVNSPTFTSLEGFKGDGTSAYLDTNWNGRSEGHANAYSLNSASFGIYYMTNTISSTFEISGAFSSLADGGVDNRTHLSRDNGKDENIGVAINSLLVSKPSTARLNGMYIGSRTSINEQKLFINKKEELNGNQISTKIPNQNIILLATDNLSGVKSFFENDKIAFSFLGKGLTSDEIWIITDAFNNYMSNMEAMSIINDATIYENNDILYSVSKIHIEAQYENKAMAWDNGYLFYSNDNSQSFVRKCFFINADKISMSRIFSNGNIIFCTQDRVYLSRDNLATYNEITVRDLDGIAISTDASGDYFREIVPHKEISFNGKNHYIWGNYANVSGRNAPVRYYHTDDYGETITAIYQFGLTSPEYGGLGDVTNTTHTRHVHAVSWNPNGNYWIAQTGDFETPDEERHVQKIELNPTTGIWTITTLNSGVWYKQTGAGFDQANNIYFSMDYASPYSGVWKVSMSDFSDNTKFVRVLNTLNANAGMINDGAGEFLIAIGYTTGIGIIQDFGTIAKLVLSTDMPEISVGNLARIYPKNNNGWYRIDTNFETHLFKSNTLFVKLK